MTISFLFILAEIIIVIFASKITFKSNSNIKAFKNEKLELGENNIFTNVIKAKYKTTDKN